jgi:hypothetical protein
VDKTIYTVSGIARYAECSEETVRRAVATGLINAVRDSSGRRLMTHTEAEKLRAHMQEQRRPAA